MRQAHVFRSSSAVLTHRRFVAPASTSRRMGAAPTVSASHRSASSRQFLLKLRLSFRRTPSGAARTHRKAPSCTAHTVSLSRSTVAAIRTRRHHSSPASIRHRRKVINSRRCMDSRHRHNKSRLRNLVKSAARMNHTRRHYHRQTPALRCRCLSSRMLIQIILLVRRPLLLLHRSILLPNRTIPTPISLLAHRRRAHTRMKLHVHPLLPTCLVSQARPLRLRRQTACKMVIRRLLAQRRLRLNGKASRSMSWSDRRRSRLLRPSLSKRSARLLIRVWSKL